jgi:hypothetical protein
VLERRLGATMRKRHGAARTAAAFDDLLGHVLILANHAVMQERARAH